MKVLPLVPENIKDHYAGFEKFVLPNDLRVYASNFNTTWVGVGVTVHAGAREDPQGLEGLAHLTEHMVCEGIPGKSCIDIVKRFETTGGTSRMGSTFFLSTMYTFSIPAQVKVLTKALNLFGRLILSGGFPRDIEKEKQIISHEMSYTAGDAMRMALTGAINRAVFGEKHPLGRWPNTSIGNQESLGKISRQDVIDFHNQYYVPANISMVMLGGLNPTEMAETVAKSTFGVEKPGQRNQLWTPEKSFYSMPPAEFGPRQNLQNQDPSSTLDDPNRKVHLFSDERTKLHFNWVLPGDLPFGSWEIFSTLLSDNLYSVLREKHNLIYGIDWGFNHFQDLIRLEISISAPQDKADFVKSAVFQIIRSTANQAKPFRRMRRSKIWQFLMTDMPGRRIIEGAMDQLERKHRINTMRDLIQQTADANMEDFARIASWLERSRCKLITPQSFRKPSISFIDKLAKAVD